MKQAMICDPVMTYPDFDREFIVTTDASKVGMGATLTQMYEEGERVVAYASRCVQPAEANYGITQLEAAAVRWAVKKWKDPYRSVGKFTIITDHKALTTVFGSKGGQTGNTTLDRWVMEMQDFTFDIVHRPGTSLGQVDHLSRSPVSSIMMILGLKAETLADYQRKDVMWGPIYRKYTMEKV